VITHNATESDEAFVAVRTKANRILDRRFRLFASTILSPIALGRKEAVDRVDIETRVVS